MMSSDCEATSLRDLLCGSINESHVGERLSVCGWVAKRREHGEHLAFLDIRDRSGVVQAVVEGLVDVKSEYVVRVTGTVTPRPEGTVNVKLPTGAVELSDCQVEVLSLADAPPFQLDDRVDIDEQVRLRYRYLDLRREAMQRNLRLRAVVNAALRRAMDAQGFCEVETPLLWAPTPEGAREFVVPSRLRPSEFYVLPQSPQIAKQLLMVGGFDRYYQIARCLRDEDLRADRQFEFTQLDLEASFVSQDDVLSFVSMAVLDAAEVATGVRPGFIERMTWAEALDLYGTDKPDLRFGMVLHDLSDVFESSEVKAFAAPTVKAMRVARGASFARSKLDELTELAKSLGAKGLAWFRVTPEGLDSPLAKFLSTTESAAISSVDGARVGDLVLVVADEYAPACRVLGALRVSLGSPPVGEGPHHYVWVTEFPMFDGVDDDGNLQAAHHPFTMPHPEDLALIETEPLKVRSQAYDLVLNGWELGSGSVRIHRADIQSRIFRALGISDDEAQSRFGFLLGAFRFGAPPHAGFAFGIDRLVAIFAGEENIREVIAFPKTQSGADLMTGAPKSITERQLRDLHLKFAPKGS
ncbi:MAG: aspartyl-tRNA synthetase [Amycolatopsis sp.]|uniref:aspartate--tRNA ligase n=1 Tax=Amycolatopsis sp. TaxID=37632 RepID=UPI0026223AC2|nr:aspartate--tRNA ligase [Amycolatopsis sp.]MCU1680158.1 aspartyl-tRNA synthetase [Amycolatopsis sp.]